MIIPRPTPDEYAPYYGLYIDQVPESDVLDLLERQQAEASGLLGDLPPERGNFRYAPGKWSLNEVLGHLSDTERVFAYRALRFSRGDAQPIPGFEQDDYVAGANFDERPLGQVLAELGAVRSATLALFRSMTPEMLARTGTASDCPFTPRAIAFIIAGHERHHLRVLRERYLNAS